MTDTRIQSELHTRQDNRKIKFMEIGLRTGGAFLPSYTHRVRLKSGTDTCSFICRLSTVLSLGNQGAVPGVQTVTRALAYSAD